MAEVAPQRKLGVFYTPHRLATAVTRWALSEGADQVLDPSCGDGRFVAAAAAELADSNARVVGVDVDANAVAAIAARNLGGVRLHVGSFFDRALAPAIGPPFGAVIGNPPYVRHQWQDPSVQNQAREALANAGVTLSRLADLWASFVIQATQHVALDGRLALVLPISATQADYTNEVWSFLKRKFGAVELAVLQDRAFENAREQVVILLASRRGGVAREVTTVVAPTIADLERHLSHTDRSAQTVEHVPDGVTAWKWSLVPAATRELWHATYTSSDVSLLGHCASVRIGIVTGANRIFVRAPDDPLLQADGVEAQTVISSSRALQAPVWRRSDTDAPTYTPGCRKLLALDPSMEPTAELADLLRRAERSNIDKRHHCSQRQPWWALRDLDVPDAFLGYMGTRPHALVQNVARSLCTNAVHRVDWKRPPSRRGAVASSWNSLYRLSAELFGRHYGGGVLKLEPAAAKRLPLLPVVGMGAALAEIDNAVRTESRAAAEAIADRATAETLGSPLTVLRAFAEAADVLADARRLRR